MGSASTSAHVHQREHLCYIIFIVHLKIQSNSARPHDGPTYIYSRHNWEIRAQKNTELTHAYHYNGSTDLRPHL